MFQRAWAELKFSGTMSTGDISIPKASFSSLTMDRISKESRYPSSIRPVHVLKSTVGFMSSNSSNNSNNNNNNPPQQTPGAGGFDTSGIGEMLKKANAVQGEPSSVDLSEIGAEEATQYGNTVIVKFNLSSQGYFDAYDNGKVSVNGKTWYVYGVAGPYMLFFTDDNPNQDAIGVFEQLAGGRTYPVKK